ncbi:unnamed protein product [Rotaria sp. Silwood2]|nr:unnamed protein product [Rotaria sp. Silwood2]CAF4208561.1 unnamed protein product [Rotaria sp. Silwood2]
MTRFLDVEKEPSSCILHEYEAHRLKGRYSNMELFKQIQEASSHNDDPKARAAHCCYIHLIGFVPGLDEKPHGGGYESEAVEYCIDDAVLYQNLSELVDKREEYAVFEDNLGPTLEKMIHEAREPSFDLLRQACSNFEKECHMEMHYATCQRSFNYFVEKGVDTDEALAYAFAISFYTGTYSEAINQNAALIVRNQNRNASKNTEIAKIDDRTAMIMYYLIKGLSHIDFYWGVVTRCVELNSKELDDYQSGFLITWLQFSSSNKGLAAPDWFKERNTIFFIYSLTGRSIQKFSNCAEDEDEVLFLPHSSFLVCHIELGLCKYVILWVDDHIFDDWWENKEHMERASTLGTEINVHFIPKSNTTAALIFLRSEFGQRLKHNETFRIVTDMNRENEIPTDNAGVRLIYQVRQLGFNNQCLVFTGDASEGRKKLAQAFQGKAMNGIQVSDFVSDLDRFVHFK